MESSKRTKTFESLKIGDLIGCNRSDKTVTITEQPGSYVDLCNLDGCDILSFLVLDKHKMYADTGSNPIIWLYGAISSKHREIFFGWVRLRHLISSETNEDD